MSRRVTPTWRVDGVIETVAGREPHGDLIEDGSHVAVGGRRDPRTGPGKSSSMGAA